MFSKPVSLRELEQRFSEPERRRIAFFWLRQRLIWQTRGQYTVRRGLDCIVASSVLLLGSPLWLLIACAIKLLDGGPVLYWQYRIGFRGRAFAFPKFRSMHCNAEKTQLLNQNQHRDPRSFKIKHDPRITSIGQLLRRTSLDEIPQLWCVLKGEMTLVGPRPPLPNEVALYGLHARQRLEITPGLTCIWQISGRSNIGFAEQLEMDLFYIRHRSITLDLKILFRTLPAVISGRGAY